MLHQVRRVLPWAKEAIGPSARCCLYIKSCEESKKTIRLNSDDCLECAPWIKTPYKFRLNSDEPMIHFLRQQHLNKDFLKDF